MRTSPVVLISVRPSFYLGFVLLWGSGEVDRQQEYLAASELWFATFLPKYSPSSCQSQSPPPLPHLGTVGRWTVLSLHPLNTKHSARPFFAVTPQHFGISFSPTPRRGLREQRDEICLLSFWYKCGYRETGVFVPDPCQSPPT